MTITDKLLQLLESQTFTAPEYCCQDCGKLATDEDDSCSVCGGEFEEFTVVPTYDWGPAY